MSEKPAGDTDSVKSIPVLPIILSVIFGGMLGHFAPTIAVKVNILGTIFLNLLFVIVIPLVMSSMISGVSGLGDIRHVGAIGLRTIIYYLTTTFFAVLTGIILVLIIQPGAGRTYESNEFPESMYTISHTPLSGGTKIQIEGKMTFASDVDAGRHIVFLADQGLTGHIATDSAISKQELSISKWIDERGIRSEPKTQGKGLSIKAKVNRLSGQELLNNFVPRNIFRAMYAENIFPLILFSLIFGAVLSTTGAVGKPLLDVVNAMNVTLIKCVILLMYLAPVGIFGLTAGSIGEAELNIPGGFLAELMRLAQYAATVLTGLAIHAVFTLVLILAFVAKRKPFKFMKNMIPQLFTAFSTGSSMATLPVSITLVTEKNKVSSRIADFVLPIGATVNMDGTALYQVVAAIFIAQVYNIQLGLPELTIMLLTATIGSIGAAAIPQAGLVTLVVVLRSVGLPVEGIGLILSIDWFVDRCRTTVNSWGDVVGCAVIDRFEK